MDLRSSPTLHQLFRLLSPYRQAYQSEGFSVVNMTATYLCDHSQSISSPGKIAELIGKIFPLWYVAGSYRISLILMVSGD